ncbi:MAG: hypothetical protein ABJO27_11450 [Pseudoruegeria sp.]
MKYVAPTRWRKWVVGVITLLAAPMFAVWIMMVPHPDIPATPVDRDHLVEWLDNIVLAQGATAISIAIVQNGEVAWEMTSGTAIPFKGQEATPQTRYHIWSVTKLQRL